MKDGEIIFIDTLSLSDIKTKGALDVMKNLAKATGIKTLASSKKPKVLTALFARNEKAEKSFRNLPIIPPFAQSVIIINPLLHSFLTNMDKQRITNGIANRGVMIVLTNLKSNASIVLNSGLY